MKATHQLDYSKHTKYQLFSLIVLCIVFNYQIAHSDWQSDLESRFDIVSTFDDLEDWVGTRPSDSPAFEEYPDEFPLKKDGSPSIWQYYYTSQDPDPNYKWIANHGSSNVWRGTGKSAVVDYNDGSDGIKYGPQRFGFKIGTKPNDGYDEVFLFFMTKWNKNFFKTTDGSYDYHRFLKTLDISSDKVGILPQFPQHSLFQASEE